MTSFTGADVFGKNYSFGYFRKEYKLSGILTDELNRFTLCENF